MTEGRKRALSKYNNSEKRKQRMKEYYDENKQTIMERNRLWQRGYHAENRERLAREKVDRKVAFRRACIEYMGGKCVYCGLQDDCPAVYDAHHRDPKEKDINISEVSPSMRMFEKIKPELDKCDLVCAVCHRKIHAKSDCCQRSIGVLTNAR